MEGKKFTSPETILTFQDILQTFQTIIEDGGGDMKSLTEFYIHHYFRNQEDKEVTIRQKEYSIVLSFLTYYGWQDPGFGTCEPELG